MRLTLLKKGLLLIAVPLLFQLVFIYVVNRALANAAEAERLVLHTKDVLVTAQSAMSDMVRVQSGGRGYVITGSPAFDSEIAADAARAFSGFESLRTKTADNPAQSARAAVLLDDARRLAEWVEGTMSLVRAGRLEEASARIIKLEGWQLMDRLRADVDEFVRHESALEAQRLQKLRDVRATQRWIIGGGIFGAALVTAFVAWLFARSITHRLQVVTSNAEAIAENRPLAERVSGTDEIGRLDEAMHETARRLRQAIEVERNLTAEVQKRATDLASANDNLRQQTQENEMFVYSVSHDLRSPLVNLQGFSRELEHAGKDLRRLATDGRIPADVRRHIEHLLTSDVDDSIRYIQTAVTRSAAIIDALLRLSRAGRVEYRSQMIDVRATVGRVVDAMSNSIESKDVRLTVGELPPCWGDPTAVEQIFGNLIGNAVNYLDLSRPGVIEVGCTRDSGALREHCNTYYVRDNGLGIPQAYLHKVFVAFQRLHGDVAKGEGIGLALVRRAVERHGGEIWAESQEGVGSTFFLALPAQDRTAQDRQEEPVDVSPPGSPVDETIVTSTL